MAASVVEQAPLSVLPYTPANPNGPFPYLAKELTLMDEGNDKSFYAVPR
jgi:hypothetical protein